MISKDPLVSIVIPTHDMAHWLPATLDSVLAQTYVHWECIVVDDGSSDKTEEVVELYRERSDKIHYLFKESGGPSSARNVGIEKSCGELIAFVDADDIWYAKKLEYQVALFATMPDTGLCCTHFEEVDEQLELLTSWQDTQRINGYKDDISAELIIGNLGCCMVPGSASAAMVRRECLEQVGVFDLSLRMGEDLDLWYRIALRYPVRAVPKVLVQLRKYTKRVDVKRVSRDLLHIAEKALTIAPPAHIKLIKRAGFDRRWSLFAISLRSGDYMRALSMFIVVTIRYPLLTVSRMQSKILRIVVK